MPPIALFFHSRFHIHLFQDKTVQTIQNTFTQNKTQGLSDRHTAKQSLNYYYALGLYHLIILSFCKGMSIALPPK